jgi:hypothetical protein
MTNCSAHVLSDAKLERFSSRIFDLLDGSLVCFAFMKHLNVFDELGIFLFGQTATVLPRLEWEDHHDILKKNNDISYECRMDEGIDDYRSRQLWAREEFAVLWTRNKLALQEIVIGLEIWIQEAVLNLACNRSGNWPDKKWNSRALEFYLHCQMHHGYAAAQFNSRFMTKAISKYGMIVPSA